MQLNLEGFDEWFVLFEISESKNSEFFVHKEDPEIFSDIITETENVSLVIWLAHGSSIQKLDKSKMFELVPNLLDKTYYNYKIVNRNLLKNRRYWYSLNHENTNWLYDITR